MRDRFSNGYIIKESVLLLFGCGFLFLFIKEPWPYVKGLVLGGLISILMFKHLYITINRSVEKEASRAQVYMTINALIRYLIYGVTIFIGAKADYLSLITTIIGILSMKYLILGENIYKAMKKKERREKWE